jgi:hypothetical protein
VSVMDLFGGIGIAVCGSPLAHLPAVLRRATNQLVARREINILDGCCQNLSVTEVITARQLFINQLAVFDLECYCCQSTVNETTVFNCFLPRIANLP